MSLTFERCVLDAGFGRLEFPASENHDLTEFATDLRTCVIVLLKTFNKVNLSDAMHVFDVEGVNGIVRCLKDYKDEDFEVIFVAVLCGFKPDFPLDLFQLPREKALYLLVANEVSVCKQTQKLISKLGNDPVAEIIKAAYYFF